MTPTLLGPGEGDVITDRPERTAIIKAGIDELALIWFRYEAGQVGPEVHVHHRHADGFYVIEGEMTFEIAGTVLTAGPGTFVVSPPMVSHTFRNESSAGGRFLNFHAPSCGFHDELRARRDRTPIEPFDQFDPPPDGGRPFADAVIGPGGARVSMIELSDTRIGSDPISSDGFDGAIAYYVIEGELVVNSELRAGPDWVVVVPPLEAHDIAGPARVVSVRT